MKVAVRKEPEGYIYIDKTFLERFTEEQLEEYNYTLVEIDDKYSDCEGYDFNDDLTFNIEKYKARIQSKDDEEKLYILQTNLEKTDYIANKLIEAETEEERQQLRLQYATQLANRKQWRKEVSDLQDKLKTLEQGV